MTNFEIFESYTYKPLPESFVKKPGEIQIFLNLIRVVSYDSVTDFIEKELHFYDIKSQTRQYYSDIDMH
jgi:hypothetical protein